MSVKLTLTNEQVKVNSALKPIFSVIEEWSSKFQNKLTLNSNYLVNKQPRDFYFHQVLRCFRVDWSQFWTSSKCWLALETITNNQEVKWSLYRLQNFTQRLYSHVLDLPISRRVVQLYRSCWTPRIHLFELINISDHSILINSNLLQRSEISALKDNEVRNEEDSTSKQAHVK